MEGLFAASSSAIRPVPSGELPSTTSKSTGVGNLARRSAMAGRFSRSLYVGTMTSVLFIAKRCVPQHVLLCSADWTSPPARQQSQFEGKVQGAIPRITVTDNGTDGTHRPDGTDKDASTVGSERRL